MSGLVVGSCSSRRSLEGFLSKPTVRRWPRNLHQRLCLCSVVSSEARMKFEGPTSPCAVMPSRGGPTSLQTEASVTLPGSCRVWNLQRRLRILRLHPCRLLPGPGLRIGGHGLSPHIDCRVAVGPTGERLWIEVFDDRSVTHFAAPRTVRCLPGSMCPLTLLFVQRDLLKARFNAAAIALLEADGGEDILKTVDAG